MSSENIENLKLKTEEQIAKLKNLFASDNPKDLVKKNIIVNAEDQMNIMFNEMKKAKELLSQKSEIDEKKKIRTLRKIN